MQYSTSSLQIYYIFLKIKTIITGQYHWPYFYSQHQLSFNKCCDFACAFSVSSTHQHHALKKPLQAITYYRKILHKNTEKSAFIDTCQMISNVHGSIRINNLLTCTTRGKSCLKIKLSNKTKTVKRN